MQVPLPPLSRKVTVGAALAGIAMVVVIAVIDGPEGFLEQLVVGGLQAGAAAAFALAGLSQIATSLRTRDWEKRTRYLALSLLERAEGELAGIEETGYKILVGSLAENDRDRLLPIGPAFRFPLGGVQAQYFAAALDAAHDANTLFYKLHTRASRKRDELLEAATTEDFASIHRSLDTLSAQVRAIQGEEVPADSEKPEAEPQPGSDAPDSPGEAGGSAPDMPKVAPGGAPQEQDVPAPSVDEEQRWGWRRGLDADKMQALADEAAEDLRARWGSFEDTIRQLGGLLDSDGARALFEASLDLRHAIWMFEPRVPEPKDDSPDKAMNLSVAQRVVWRTDRAYHASTMVLQVLMTGWLVLAELDDVFERRLGDFPAATDYRKFNEKSDEIDALALEQHETSLELGRSLGELHQDVRKLFDKRQGGPPTPPSPDSELDGEDT